MLRESSMRTPRKFCWGTAAFRISDGLKRQKVSRAIRASRNATSVRRSRVEPLLETNLYDTRASAATRARAKRASVIDRDAANVKSPCSKVSAGYLKKNVKSQPIAGPISRHSTGRNLESLKSRVKGAPKP